MFFNPDPYVKITIVPSNHSVSSSISSSSSSSSAFSANLSSSIFSGNSSRPSSSMLHGYVREYKTFIATNTCFPVWKNEVKFRFLVLISNSTLGLIFGFFLKNFIIVARENDRILFEVKDKFARTKPSINRFLGRVLVDIKTLIEKTKHTKG